MEKQDFVSLCNAKIKPVRGEYALSQDKMAQMLGISKKTLVEIEKGRSSLGWTGSVALCAVFVDSEILGQALGVPPTKEIPVLAREGIEQALPQTMGGRVWWRTVMKNQSYTIQQNMLFLHYRLLTADGRRIASSLILEDLLPKLGEPVPRNLQSDDEGESM